MQNAYIIMDGQWGSSGKGLLAGYLAKERKPDVIVCNFGPNAGHTVITTKGGSEKKVMTQQLPSGIIARSAHTILLGPGSIINPAILLKEMTEYGHYLPHGQVLIHPNASVVTPWDIEQESEAGIAISSTRKGVGSALAMKVRRIPKPSLLSGHAVVAKDCPELWPFLVSDKNYRAIIHSAKMLQIESAQGVELSLSHGLSYPYCTSRDITVEAIMNDVGVNRFQLNEVFVAMRTFPIRVGNEYKDGKEIGNSGPVYPDMDELSWSQMSAMVGMPLEEKTTVTQKVRRIFTWSDAQFERMLGIVGPCSLFINFMNYLDKDAKGIAEANSSAKRFAAHVDWLAQKHTGTADFSGPMPARVKLLGWGPAVENVEAMRA